MDLTTRCPHCGSTFAASLEQLQLRKGYIRCVSCANIFDGFDSVVPATEAEAATPRGPKRSGLLPVVPSRAADDEPDNGLNDDATEQREPSISMPSVLRQRPVNNEGPTHIVPPSPDRFRTNARPAFTISGKETDTAASRQDPVFKVTGTTPLRPDPVIGPLHAGATQQASAATVAGIPTRRREPMAHRVADDEDPSGPELYVEPRHDRAAAAIGPSAPAFLHRREESGQGALMRSVWMVGTVVAILVLVAQLTYVYRAQIANNVPALRPVLEQACSKLECEVPYSRRINQIAIVSSSLRAVAKPAKPVQDGADTMVLQLVLRNSFDKAQEWPTLVLDLTDFSGTVVVRKNLPPESYLTEDQLQRPFAPSSETAVTLPLALNGMKVNGYQLDKFYQ